MNKKIASTVSVLLFFLLTSAAVFAGELTHSAPLSVSIGSDGIADIEIVVTGGYEMYAGAQFELILGDGVAIESVSFDKGNNSNIIPPTEARGSYFFSLFAGTNEFEGDFTCTVTISFGGIEMSQVTIAEIQRYYINGPGDVATTIDSTQSVIQILPAKAVGNTVLPLGGSAPDLIWIIIIIAIIAGIVMLVLLRARIRKSSGEDKITINKAEYERLLAKEKEARQQSKDIDRESDS